MAGKDVIGDMHINYIGIIPLVDTEDEEVVVGTQIQQVLSVDARGSMPDWVKNKMAKTMAKNIVNMAKFL